VTTLRFRVRVSGYAYWSGFDEALRFRFINGRTVLHKQLLTTVKTMGGECTYLVVRPIAIIQVTKGLYLDLFMSRTADVWPPLARRA
jgi:hypothetical protein